MKSHYGPYSKSEIERRAKQIAREELNKIRDELYEMVEKDCVYQAIAVTMYELHKLYGFGPKRLKRLKNAIEDEYVLMMQKPLGKDYNPKDVMEWLKEHYQIDFEESQYEE